MVRDLGPGAIVGWIKGHAEDSGLAGAAFFISPNIALTCAHVVRDHLGLGKPTPSEAPVGKVMIRLESLGSEVVCYVAAKGWLTEAV